ncbi:hypothetical protein QC760_002424 [Botrytis cinerea]
MINVDLSFHDSFISGLFSLERQIPVDRDRVAVEGGVNGALIHFRKGLELIRGSCSVRKVLLTSGSILTVHSQHTLHSQSYHEDVDACDAPAFRKKHNVRRGDL